MDERPPAARLALLGAQYALMAAIYLILVAIILRSAGGLSRAEQVVLMGVACVALAIGTAMQALPRGPVGSGFLAPPVYSATFLAPSVLAAKVGGMELVFGMTLFAGAVEVLLALALLRLRVVITPVLSGLTVFVVGLQLGVVGIGETLDVRHAGQPGFPLHLVATTLTLAVCVGLSIWGHGALKLLCSMAGLSVGLVAAAAVGLLGAAELRALDHAAWFALPWPPMPERRFDLGLAPAFFAAGVAAGLRTVGVVTTCQRLNDAAWRRPDMANVRRGVLADGLSNLIGGALGAPGMSAGPSLVGVSGATGATSRAIAFASAAVLLVVGLSPKLAGAMLLVPPEVAGSLLVFSACFMIAGGMSIMLSRPAETRTVYVIGISTLLALSENVFPAYFRELPPAARSLAGSPLALGLTAALVLTLAFRLGTRRVAETTWRAEAESIEAAVAFLRARGSEWKVEAGTLQTAAAEVRDILARVALGKAAGGPLRAAYDGMELRVEVRHGGGRVARLPEARTPPAAVRGELEDEEAAAYVGLRNFIQGLSADRKEVRVEDGGVVVALSYVA